MSWALAPEGFSLDFFRNLFAPPFSGVVKNAPPASYRYKHHPFARPSTVSPVYFMLLSTNFPFRLQWTICSAP